MFYPLKAVLVDITLDKAKPLLKMHVLLLKPCLYQHTVKININNALHEDTQIFITILSCSCFERASL